MFHRLVPYFFVVAATCAAAETPCDFKGVSVGEKTTPSSLMASLGIKNYKMNPERWQSDKFLELGKKYGLTSAAEIEEWNAGPACDSDSCRIPFGVGVGNSNSPVSVFVSFPGGRITEIDVAFNKTYWDEIRPVLDRKYGASWHVEQDPNFVITELETKKSFTVERITLTHRPNGTNRHTGDACMIWGVNYDVVFQHHDPLGAYHSVFAIKLVSNNF
ncbi:hypothetical protein [Paraburkholderia hospita]|uniref:hypothetical protein n=1 Tax=Paraburkholderia hospita TaxID=169430 RepID=UPI003ECCB067